MKRIIAKLVLGNIPEDDGTSLRTKPRVQGLRKGPFPLDFAPEFFRYIFTFLPPQDILNAQKVCKDWSEQGGDDSLWKIKFEQAYPDNKSDSGFIPPPKKAEESWKKYFYRIKRERYPDRYYPEEHFKEISSIETIPFLQVVVYFISQGILLIGLLLALLRVLGAFGGSYTVFAILPALGTYGLGYSFRFESPWPRWDTPRITPFVRILCHLLWLLLSIEILLVGASLDGASWALPTVFSYIPVYSFLIVAMFHFLTDAMHPNGRSFTQFRMLQYFSVILITPALGWAVELCHHKLTGDWVVSKIWNLKNNNWLICGGSIFTYSILLLIGLVIHFYWRRKGKFDDEAKETFEKIPVPEDTILILFSLSLALSVSFILLHLALDVSPSALSAGYALLPLLVLDILHIAYMTYSALRSGYLSGRMIQVLTKPRIVLRSLFALYSPFSKDPILTEVDE